MKPYFAKYLPVEGEIKEGDYCTALYDDVIVKLGKGETPWPNSKKVKLFLCSRDIKVGDKVRSIHTPTHEIVAEGCEVYNPLNSYFKVIGEILTEGIKEDQEFDENTVKYLTIAYGARTL